jgi:hypothetical protein
MNRRRILTLAICTALLVALGVVSASAEPTLWVEQTSASPGDDVHFTIDGTHGDDTYVLKIGDQEVAKGSDPEGNGVDDTFKMPDLGNSDQDISIDAIIEQSGVKWTATATLKYTAPVSGAPTGPTGNTVPAAAPAAAPAAVTTPASTRRRTTSQPQTVTSPTRTHKRSTTNRQKSSSGGGSGNSGRSVSTPTYTPSTTSSGSSHRATPSGAVSTPTTPPSGPSGLVGLGQSTPSAPASTPSASVSPVSGTVDIGKSGFLMGLALGLLALLAAGGLALVIVRVTRDWRPAFVYGQASDDARLTALSRVSASTAETQRTIAERRATRTAGRFT